MNQTESEKTSPSYEITKLNIVGTWNFASTDVTDGICTMCRGNLMLPSITNLNKGITSCQISIGQCNHPYHSECINNWLSKNNTICPNCKTPWTLKSELDTANTWRRLQLDRQKMNLKANNTAKKEDPVPNSNPNNKAPVPQQVLPAIENSSGPIPVVPNVPVMLGGNLLQANPIATSIFAPLQKKAKAPKKAVAKQTNNPVSSDVIVDDATQAIIQKLTNMVNSKNSTAAAAPPA